MAFLLSLRCDCCCCRLLCLCFLAFSYHSCGCLCLCVFARECLLWPTFLLYKFGSHYCLLLLLAAMMCLGAMWQWELYGSCVFIRKTVTLRFTSFLSAFYIVQYAHNPNKTTTNRKKTVTRSPFFLFQEEKNLIFCSTLPATDIRYFFAAAAAHLRMHILHIRFFGNKP